MIKHRLFLPTLILLGTWAGCGTQAYFIHQRHVQQHEMEVTVQRLMDASRRLDDAKRHVEEESERLEQLLKMLPPQPAPDRRSKL